MRELGTGENRITVDRGGRKLACGYTTGSCAAAAAKGAAALLLLGEVPEEILLPTPKGILLRLEPAFCRLEGDAAVCGIRKDAGDDPDITDGVVVCVRAERCEDAGERIRIAGGEGVGRVTRPGLEQPVGEAAINRIPREMIRAAAEEIAEEAEYDGGLLVTVSVPGGEALAKKTFNPKLGIEGGLSILGTSGIVEPMSEEALVECIRLEIRMRRAVPREGLVLIPGNYGLDFLKGHFAPLSREAVRCSNYIGAAVDEAASCGMRELLLISHIGKLIKVAGGIMNTHSREGDCRLELMSAFGLRAGCSAEAARCILDCSTTEAALAVLAREGCLREAMRRTAEAAAEALSRRSGGRIAAGVLTFSSERGELARSSRFDEIAGRIGAGTGLPDGREE